MDIIRSYLTNLFANSFDFNANITNLLTKLVIILIWIFLGLIFSTIIKKIIKSIPKGRVSEKRKKTVVNLMQNVFKTVFWFYIFMMILNELGIDVMPILAGAGILAFAVGFGAQELIKDVISGFFIIVEHLFDVGDTIEVSGFKGKVTELGIRKTKITNWKNEIKIINNGDIRNLINYSLIDSVAVIEFIVSYESDLSFFRSDIFNKFLFEFNKNKNLLNPIKFIGVIDLLPNGYQIRFSSNTINGEQYGIERLFKEEILKMFKTNNISITPYISVKNIWLSKKNFL